MSGHHPYDGLKRCIDVIVALAGLILTSPVQAVIALLVRSDLGAPVLYRQVRPGRDEELFELLKFRSMRDLGEHDGPHNDSERLTPLGRALRSTSLDELPSLWNVLKGEMSLVGPRPLLVQYLDRYSTVEHRRHEVRPGITGLAQVSGRNALTWEDKLRLDVEYVDRRSLRLDLQILLRTLVVALRRQGISGGNSATMSEFLGSSTRSNGEVSSRPG